jgi:TetR/AcrR family transcriptional regulator, transcriptional repressor for nem operon
MRYSGQHKQETRTRVLREAANAIRANGPDGVAVTDIMARAGLTHGGFYAHFATKNDLVADAVVTMFDEVGERIATIGGSGDARTSLRNVLAYYLSPEHRDDRAGGCPMPALSGELARASAPARRRFTEGVSAMVARIAAALQSIGIENADREAHALQAQLVGAVSLARAVDSAALADAILRDTLAQIVERLGLADR